MHGLRSISRSNALAVAGAGRYEAQVLDAAKVEIARLQNELREAQALIAVLNRALDEAHGVAG